jgi:hypothetical protein
VRVRAADCRDILRLEIAEYELARRQPTYFLCAPEHHAITKGGTVRIVTEGLGS